MKHLNYSLLALLLSTLHFSLIAQTPDSTFGVRPSFEGFTGQDQYGVTACDFEGRQDRAYAALHLSDGKIVLAGHTSGQDGTDFALVRLLPDGQYDAEAGPQGQIRIDLGYANDSCLIAALTPDEAILMGGCVTPPGQSGYAALVAKVDLDGGLETTFGNGGQVVLNLPSDFEIVTAIIPMADGRTLVAGNAWYGSSMNFPDSTKLFISRLLPDGQVDIAFGTNGFIYWQYRAGCRASILEDMVVDGEGRIVVTGGLYDPYPGITDGSVLCYNPNIRVCRFLPNGQPDPAFGNGGTAEIPQTPGYASVLHAEEDGKIFVSGTMVDFSLGFPFISKMMPNGALDSGFIGNGRLIQNTQYTILGLEPPVEPLGVLKAGGAYYLNYGTPSLTYSHAPFGLVRFEESGAIDTAFGSSYNFSFGCGFNSTDWFPNLLFNVAFNIEQLSIRDDHSIFLTGTYRVSGNHKMVIAKLNLETAVPATSPEALQNLSVFPNPVRNGKLYLDCSNTRQQGPTKLRWYDLYGRMVHGQSVTLAGGANEVSVPGLTPGLYAVEVVGQGFRQVLKILIEE